MRGAAGRADLWGMSFSALDIALTAFVALVLLTFALLIWDLAFRTPKGRRSVQAAYPPEQERPRLQVAAGSRRGA
jgi:hypothetical protein